MPPSATTTSPIDSILPTNSNEQEQPTVVMRARTPTVGDRLQSLFTRDSSAGGASDKSSSAARRRMTVQNTRSNASTRDTIIELVQEPSSVPERRRASSFIGKHRLNCLLKRY